MKANWKMLFVVSVIMALLLSACGGKAANSGSESPSASKSASPSASTANSSESSASTPAGEPIRVGALITQSGPQAIPGESARRGIELYFEHINYTIGDRKVEIKFEDDEGNPQVGLRKYRQLINSQKVDAVIGPLLSNVVYALTEEVSKVKKPLIIITAAANDISWSKKSDYIFRTSKSNWQSGSTAGDYFAKKLGKKAYIVATDYPAGHENQASFKYAFEAAGGQVIGAANPPVGANDFATYLNEIKQKKPDLVFAFMPGADGFRLIKQYNEFGLKGSIPLTSPGEFSDVLVAQAAAPESEGIQSVLEYYPGLDNAVNKKFVEDYKAKYNELPNFYSVQGFDAAQAFAEAVKKANGSVKPEDLLKVFPGLTIQSPRGEITIDPKTHNPNQTYYAGKNVLKDGKMTFEMTEKIGVITMPETDPSKK